MEQIPIISANKIDTGNGQTEPVSSKHMVHPNASVLALGVLLCELHYCTPVESWQNDTKTGRNVNTDYYTSLDLLKNLEVDAGVDYYLATKACLQWEYFLAGELTSFESARVRSLFYQNVVKRLESEICKSWRLRLEDLNFLILGRMNSAGAYSAEKWSGDKQASPNPLPEATKIGSLFASGLQYDVSELYFAQ